MASVAVTDLNREPVEITMSSGFAIRIDVIELAYVESQPGPPNTCKGMAVLADLGMQLLRT